MLQELDEKLAKTFGLDRPKGALVSDVIKGDPADKAGIKAGDVILEVSGKEIENHKELINIIGSKSPGEVVKLKILREGKIINISVKLGERKTSLASKDNEIREDISISVENLSDTEKSKLGINTGVKVAYVDETSNAYEAGLRKGDIIVWINRKEVKDKETFYSIYDSIKKDEIVGMKILSMNGSRFIAFNKDK
jgi:serine protease Do